MKRVSSILQIHKSVNWKGKLDGRGLNGLCCGRRPIKPKTFKSI